jgi:hypothetical protein
VNQLPFLVKQLPFFGFLFVGSFVLLILIFKYRTRTSLAIYYLSFVTLALGLSEFWMWAEARLDRSSEYFEGGYPANHIIPDKELGFGLAPGPRQVRSIKRSRNGESIYDVSYGINALGLREVAPNGAGPPVFFFGDTFTFGEGVGDTDTLPARFAQISGYSAFNFGVRGYGPHQFLRMLEIARPEQIGIRKEHALVVFALLPTHVDQAAGRASWDADGPLYQISSTGLNLRGSFRSQRSITERILSRSYIYKLIQSSLSETIDRQRVLAILEMANKIVRHRYGTDMLVVVWDIELREPPKYAAARAAWIKDGLAKSGIANISVSQVMPPLQAGGYYIAGDAHPDPAAYVALAKAIFKYCNDVDCLKYH